MTLKETKAIFKNIAEMGIGSTHLNEIIADVLDNEIEEDDDDDEVAHLSEAA